jgi:hypothetical protein
LEHLIITVWPILWKALSMEGGRFIPIPPDSKSIRLLLLEPGHQDNDIYCSLRIAHFEDEPEYEALSYVWGQQDITELIECSGKQIPVTRSLASALRVLRRSSVPRRLWVDQLCIDQNNVAERNHQVSMMNIIYYVADRVLVWLGPDAQKEADVAFKLIHQLARQGDWDPNFFKIDYFPDDDFLRQAGLPIQESPDWNALRSLFSLPYFERMWVLQEVLVSRDATFFWGSCQIPWRDTFGLAVIWAAANKFGFPSLDDQFQGIPEMARAEILVLGRDSLIGLLDHTRERKAADPRDKFFALLGITRRISGNPDVTDKVPFFGETLIKPDYRLSLRDVYLSVTRTILAESENVDLLSFVDHGIISSEPDHLRSLPQWVPRWQPCAPWRIDSTKHQASGSIRAKISTASGDAELALEGIVVDKISHTGLLLSNGLESTSSDMPTWQLGLFEGGCFVDESITEVQSGSLMHLFKKHSGVDEPSIANSRNESTESLQDALEAASYHALRQVTGEEQVWKDPITEGWQLAVHGAADSCEAAKTITSFLSTVSGTTVSVDTFIQFARSRFGSLFSAIELATGSGDCSKLVEHFWGSYLDSAIEAAIHWDNITRDSEQPKDVISAAVIGDFISHFHSEDKRVAKYATRALKIVASQTESAADFERNFEMRGQCRRFVVTEKGTMGLTHPSCRRGDIVCILFGGRTPFVLRPTLEPHCYTFLSECYVPGIMDGEAIKRWGKEELKSEVLRLY